MKGGEHMEDDITKVRELLKTLGFKVGDTDFYTDGTKVSEYFKDGVEIDIIVPANV